MKVRPAPSYLDNLPRPPPGPPRDWGLDTFHYLLLLVPNIFTAGIVLWFGCQNTVDKSASISVSVWPLIAFFVNVFMEIIFFVAAYLAIEQRNPLLLLPLFMYLAILLLLFSGIGAFFVYFYYYGAEAVFRQTAYWYAAEAKYLLWLVSMVVGLALWAIISLLETRKIRRNMIRQLDEERAEHTQSLFS